MHLLIPIFLAAAKAPAKATPSSSGALFEIILIALVAYFAYRMFVRPQSARTKAQQAALKQVEVGDEILTTAGIFATVLEVSDDRLTVQVSPGNTMDIVRSAIARRISDSQDDHDNHEDNDDHDHDGHDHEGHDHEDEGQP